jgi:hypothetical protein
MSLIPAKGKHAAPLTEQQWRLRRIELEMITAFSRAMNASSEDEFFDHSVEFHEACDQWIKYRHEAGMPCRIDPRSLEIFAV